jgi:hypothetical protein
MAASRVSTAAWNERWSSGKVFMAMIIGENIEHLGRVQYPPYYLEVNSRRYYIFIVVQSRASNE